MSQPSFGSLQEVVENVSRETFDALTHFEQRFRVWSSRINLVAASTLDELWSRHILDSAQLLPLAPSASHWVDLGSGGGFPGLVIAILAKGGPGAHVNLVESNRKKAAFLQSIVGEMSLPATVHAIRIDNAFERTGVADVVTARALAPLDALLRLSEPWLASGAKALFHKGREYRCEIEESAHNWQFDLIEHASRIDQASAILEISGPRRKAA